MKRKIIGRPVGDLYIKEGWSVCGCGKERFLTIREETEELVDAMWRLYSQSMCHTCELQIAQKMNFCPEAMPIEGGFSACGKGFAHTGRCEPRFTEAERKQLHQQALKHLKEQQDAATEKETDS